MRNNQFAQRYAAHYRALRTEFNARVAADGAPTILSGWEQKLATLKPHNHWWGVAAEYCALQSAIARFASDPRNPMSPINRNHNIPQHDLDKYNRLYNNASHRLISERLTRAAVPEAERDRFMNLVIDSALEACGAERYAGSVIYLAQEVANCGYLSQYHGVLVMEAMHLHITKFNAFYANEMRTHYNDKCRQNAATVERKRLAALLKQAQADHRGFNLDLVERYFRYALSETQTPDGLKYALTFARHIALSPVTFLEGRAIVSKAADVLRLLASHLINADEIEVRYTALRNTKDGLESLATAHQATLDGHTVHTTYAEKLLHAAMELTAAANEFLRAADDTDIAPMYLSEKLRKATADIADVENLLVTLVE